MCYAKNPDGSVDRDYLDKPGRTDTWFDNLARDEIKREDRRYARAGTPFKGLLSRKSFRNPPPPPAEPEPRQPRYNTQPNAWGWIRPD